MIEMATGGSDLLERVQDQLLECPICRESYEVTGRTPRVLPCHHVLCGACLLRLRAQQPFRCPVCRKPLSGQEFPTETTRMTLLDLVSKAKTSADATESPDVTDRCEQHKKELEFCCYDCQTLLCSKCAMLLHRAHRVEDLEPLVHEKRRQVLEVRQRIEAILPKFQTRVSRSEAIEASLAIGKDKAAAKIRAMFSEMATQIKTREKQALQALEAMFEANRRMLEEEQEGEQALLTEAETLVQASQSLASRSPPTQLMCLVPWMEQSFAQLQERALPDQLTPPVYQVETGGMGDLSQVLASVGNTSVLPRQPLAAPRQQMSNDFQTQRRIYRLKTTPLREGDVWYLVDIGWFRQWKKYVCVDATITAYEIYFEGEKAHPGCIDNSPLFKPDGSGQLREGMIENFDYVQVPEEAWVDLESLYGLVDNRHRIARRVIEQGRHAKSCKVEVYPLELKLYHQSDPYNFVLKQFCPTDKVGKLEDTMRNVFRVPANAAVCLWSVLSDTFVPLRNPEESLPGAGLSQGQGIVIEMKQA